MNVIELFFWVSVFLVLHTYLLYPLLLVVASSVIQTWRDLRYLHSREERRRILRDPLPLPGVS